MSISATSFKKHHHHGIKLQYLHCAMMVDMYQDKKDAKVNMSKELSIQIISSNDFFQLFTQAQGVKFSERVLRIS